MATKFDDKITKVSKTSTENPLETMSSKTENIGFNVEIINKKEGQK